MTKKTNDSNTFTGPEHMIEPSNSPVSNMNKNNEVVKIDTDEKLLINLDKVIENQPHQVFDQTKKK